MAKLDRGQALASLGDPRLDHILGLQIGQSRQPNRFHVDEDVRIGVAHPIEEAIALDAIEPLHLHRLERSRGVRQRLAVGTVGWRNGRSNRARQGFAEIDRNYSPRLQPAILLFNDAFDQRAFGQASSAVVAKHRKMNEHIAVALVADQKTEAASRVEPFNPAGNMETVAIVMMAIILSMVIRAAGRTVAFAIVIARAKNGVRDNRLSISRRTGDRRRTLH